MPPQFYAYQLSVTASAGADKEINDRIELGNFTVYSNTGNDNMTFPYTSLDPPDLDGDGNDADWSAGLPSGQYLEIWWSQVYAPYALEFRHTTWMGWYWAYTSMVIYGKNGFSVVKKNGIFDPSLGDNSLADNWDDTVNASVFSTKTPVCATYLITYNMTKYNNITDAWNGGELGYLISFDLDRNATGMSVWGLIGAILLFQSPYIGIEGLFGTLLTTMIAIPVWILSIMAFVKIIQSIIPFIKGVEE